MKLSHLLPSILLPSFIFSSPLLSSCSNNEILYVALPTYYYNIETIDNKVCINGIVSVNVAPSFKGYNTITIPNNIQSIKSIAKQASDNRLDEIIYMNYQSKSILTEIQSFSISKLDNLESISFPSSLTYIGDNAIFSCSKLNTLDFSSFDKMQSFIDPIIINGAIAKQGTIYVKNESIKKDVEVSFKTDDRFSDWKVIIK